MFCEKCGNKLNGDDLFCSNCGTKSNVQQTSINQLNTNVKRSNSQFIVSLISFIIFILVVLVLGGILIYMHTTNADSNSGWLFVGAIWLSLLPLLASFIMSIISIILYLKNREKKRKIETLFYILNWITAILLFVPMFRIFVIS